MDNLFAESLAWAYGENWKMLSKDNSYAVEVKNE